MNNPVADLREAAHLLRCHADGATDIEGTRWMVDQSENDGLIVGSYAPGDVLPDGGALTACVAFFAYPDDQDGKTYRNALAVASHMAWLDPAVAQVLAAWLLMHAFDLERRNGNVEYCDSPADVQWAIQIARTYLRREA